MKQGVYSEAEIELENYLKKVGSDELVERHLESCKKSSEWKNNPTGYVVVSELPLNTNTYDWATAWADKRKNTFIFSSTW